MSFYRFLLILSLLIIGATSQAALLDVDFDKSSGLDLMNKYSAKYAESGSSKKIQILKQNYNNLIPSKVPYSLTPLIPKIIHQIWLGPEEIPKNYRYYQQTWKLFNPSWQFKLWTEEEILKENFPNIDLYWLARSYHERSDIIRYEILRKYGGLYVDSDTECYANFDELHHKYDFYTNFEPPSTNKKRVNILNSLIGAAPNHPILNITLERIRKNWSKVENMFENIYGTQRTSFISSNHHLAVQRTMYAFADSVFQYLTTIDPEKNKSIVFPSGYNLPLYFINDVPIVNFLSRIFRDQSKLSTRIIKQPETLSIHFQDRHNSLLFDDFFANSLFNNSEIKGIFYMLLNLRDKYYTAFRNIFKTNSPSKVEYNVFSLIPKKIFIQTSSKSDFKTLSDEWQKLNPLCEIKILDKEQIYSYIPQQFNFLSEKEKSIIAKFYLLKTEGGVFVDSSFTPTNLSEYIQKYGFFGKIDKVTKFSDKISINHDIIAIHNMHSIIRNFILLLEETLTTSKEINDNVVKKLFKENIYKYRDLDGKSILLPEIYFAQKR